MGRFLQIVVSVIILDMALGYLTSGGNCDVFCMHNIGTIEAALTLSPAVFFDGDSLAVTCTTSANMSACFDAAQGCTSGIDRVAVEAVIEEVCSNKNDIEKNKACFMDNETGIQIISCFQAITRTNYCDLPTCMLNKLSTVSSCASGGNQLISDIFTVMLRSDNC